MPISDGVPKILRVDLTSGESSVETAPEIFQEWMGGTGVGTYLFSEEMKKAGYPDPLAPQVPIVFTIGALGSLYPMITKSVVTFRSPQTGEFGQSYAGGRFSACMRLSDLDAIIITGKAPDWRFLWVDNKNVDLLDATPLAGLSTYATFRVLREQFKEEPRKRTIVRIGVGGEKLIPYANLAVDQFRHFGRLGSGAVFGSKNLKALMVSGNYSYPLPHETFKDYQLLYKEIFDQCMSPTMSKYHDLGTAINVEPLSQIGGLPTRNFKQGYFEGAKYISGAKFAEESLAYKVACTHCPVACIHVAHLREQFATEHEYETLSVAYDHELIYALGSTLSIDDVPDILRLIHKIERYGLDSITTGVTLAWATDAFLSGLISTEDTAGLAFAFGNTDNYLKAVDHIVHGTTQFYTDLQLGAEEAAKKYGGQDFAICFGGLEAPGYMTGRDFIVGFSMSPRNSHLSNAGYSVDQKALAKPTTPEEEVQEMVNEANWRNILNSLTICLFARGIFTKEIVLRCFAALGKEWTAEQFDELGKKIHRLKFEVKQQLGWKLENIRVPERLYQVVTARGIVKKDEVEQMLREYWEIIESY
jgi:aldehyde:ferredoxin oxidoreductase